MNGKVKIILSMLIFGTISLFVREIPLTSAQIAFYRGVLGSGFLLGLLLLRKEKIPSRLIRQNWKFLLLSGFSVGINWILLFEAYRYTTVSNATLSYYFQPIFLTLLAPVFLRESLTMRKIGCVLLALAGMFCIIGVSGTDAAYDHPLGIGLGLTAAFFYAIGVISNKKISGLADLQLTSLTLLLATLILMPYVLLTGGLAVGWLTAPALGSLLVLGIVHTGFAYVLVFSGLQQTPSQTFAVLSYIDPVTAVLISALFLQEPVSGLQLFGGFLILAAAYWNERSGANRQKGNRQEG